MNCPNIAPKKKNPNLKEEIIKKEILSRLVVIIY